MVAGCSFSGIPLQASHLNRTAPLFQGKGAGFQVLVKKQQPDNENMTIKWPKT
jgi:hypothetical protein